METQRFNIRLPDDLKEKIEKEAKEKNITMTAVIKIAISEYFKNK